MKFLERNVLPFLKLGRFFLTFFTLAFLFAPSELFATHIVGGEMNYRYIGGNNYQIRLTVFRDCFNGVPSFDDPASVGVFDSNGNLLFDFMLERLEVNMVPSVINSPCLVPPTNVCYEITTYIDTFNLPPLSGGYQLVYQRCCRNGSIANIINPGQAGATYIARIPDPGLVTGNSNPVFVNLPPTFICNLYPFTFNHAAFDFDGDSLVYSLFTPLNGASSMDPMPQPPNPPPYLPVQWQGPFGLANVLGGPVPLSINSQNGTLIATPNTNGQFVYGVRVQEFRNGIYISETMREFQVNVVSCVGLVVASIQSPIILCGSFTAAFTNGSVGAASYAWDFGDLSTNLDVSNLEQPSYTYPDTGTYNVRLVAYSGTNPLCNDTSYAIVKVYPPLVAEMGKLFDKCFNTVFFFDSTQSFSGVINSWTWTFGDGGTSNSQSSAHAFAPGTYIVTLNVSTVEGCTDQVMDTVTLFPPLFANIDSIIPATCSTVCNGYAEVNAIGGLSPYQILWSTGDTLNFIDSLCPGNYSVLITDSNGCIFQSNAVIDFTFFVSFSGVLPSVCPEFCIGEANIFIGGGDEPYSVLWSNGDTTQAIDSLCAGKYYVTATDSNNCTLTDSVTIIDTFDSKITREKNTSCFGSCDGLGSVQALGGGEPYLYTWSNGSVGEELDSLCVGLYYVTTVDTNGCVQLDSVLISQPPILEDHATKVNSGCPAACDGSAQVTAIGGTPPYLYSWNNSTPVSNPDLLGLCPGKYIVFTTDENGCVTSDSIEITNRFNNPFIETSSERDTIFLGESTNLYSDPGSGYSYLWDNPNTLNNNSLANPIASPNQNTLYLLKVVDENGCVSFDTLSLYVITDYCQESSLFIPNAFTPNGDGRNDVFRLRAKGINEFTLQVYNRWGEMVFETREISNGWDGTYKGEAASADVYVYYLKTVCFDKNRNFKKGNVTLIR